MSMIDSKKPKRERRDISRGVYAAGMLRPSLQGSINGVPAGNIPAVTPTRKAALL